MTVVDIITSVTFRMHQLFDYFLLLIHYFLVSFNTLSISQNIINVMKGLQTAQFPKASTQTFKIMHGLNLQ